MDGFNDFLGDFGPGGPESDSATPREVDPGLIRLTSVGGADIGPKDRIDCSMDPEALSAAFGRALPAATFESLRTILAQGLSHQGLANFTDEELIAWVASVESLGSLVDSARVFAAGEVSHRCTNPNPGRPALNTRTGCRNAVEILERLTGQSSHTLRGRLTMAKLIEPGMSMTGDPLSARLPVVAAALSAGAPGWDGAELISATLGRLDKIRTHPADLHAAEVGLVAMATGRAEQSVAKLAERSLSVPPVGVDHFGDFGRASDFLALPRDVNGPYTHADLRIAANAWALALDPDGTLPSEDRNRRGVYLGRMRDGLIPMRGNLQPEVASQLTTLFDAYLNPRCKTDTVTEPGEGHIRAEAAVSDPRSWDEKRHDAFAAILMKAAANPDTPLLGGAAPTLVVTIDAADLKTCAASERGECADGTCTDKTGRCVHSAVAFITGHHSELGHDGAIDARTAMHLGCTGAVQRIVHSADGRILSLSTPQRVFNSHQRRAIMARDGGCVVPGCDVPATWCEVHHVHPRANGGPTHTDNGVLLCWYHHRNLERLGWDISMTAGVPRVVPRPTRLRPYQPFAPQRTSGTPAPRPARHLRNLQAMRRHLLRNMPPAPGNHTPPRRC